MEVRKGIHKRKHKRDSGDNTKRNEGGDSNSGGETVWSKIVHII